MRPLCCSLYSVLVLSIVLSDDSHPVLLNSIVKGVSETCRCSIYGSADKAGAHRVLLVWVLKEPWILNENRDLHVTAYSPPHLPQSRPVLVFHHHSDQLPLVGSPRASSWKSNGQFSKSITVPSLKAVWSRTRVITKISTAHTDHGRLCSRHRLNTC